jgi:hypothetical protein
MSEIEIRKMEELKATITQLQQELDKYKLIGSVEESYFDKALEIREFNEIGQSSISFHKELEINKSFEIYIKQIE